MVDFLRLYREIAFVTMGLVVICVALPFLVLRSRLM